jgi:pimeloyl-ACP methyl ester carboxylesterase
MRLRAFTRLVRWLGPWAGPDSRPERVSCKEIEVAPASEGRAAERARLYAPEDDVPIGSYLVAHGLAVHGPLDPRLDRFARVLAHAGFVVLVPFLPDFMTLRVTPQAATVFSAGLRTLVGLPERPARVRPGLFGISFGSLPVLRVAGSPETASDVGAVIVFGGHADLHATMRFCLGAGPRGGDPLTIPAVSMNLLGQLENVPQDIGPVVDAWLAFARDTWSREDMKARERYMPLAERLAAGLDEEQARFFLLGCGLTQEDRQVLLDAVDRRTYDPLLEPREGLQGLRCPVHLFHGADDDVIPCREMFALAEAMPPGVGVRTHLTGLYRHSRAPRFGELLSSAPALAREGTTLLRMVGAIVSAGTRPRETAARRC